MVIMLIAAATSGGEWRKTTTTTTRTAQSISTSTTNAAGLSSSCFVVLGSPICWSMLMQLVTSSADISYMTSHSSNSLRQVRVKTQIEQHQQLDTTNKKRNSPTQQTPSFLYFHLFVFVVSISESFAASAFGSGQQRQRR